MILLSLMVVHVPVGLKVSGARNVVVLYSTFTNISNGTGVAIVTDGNPIVLDLVPDGDTSSIRGGSDAALHRLTNACDIMAPRSCECELSTRCPVA